MGVIQDQQQFIDLFDRYHKYLCMIAMQYLKDMDVAEDIVQEFFIAYWQKHKDMPLKISFEAYACRAIKNRCIDRIRSSNAEDKRLNQYALDNIEETDADQPEVNVEELKLQVLQLIDQLPAERKRVFIMSAREHKTYAAIAAELGISVNTVKSQMVKAYSFIRENAKVTYKHDQDGDVNDVMINVAILLALLSMS